MMKFESPDVPLLFSPDMKKIKAVNSLARASAMSKAKKFKPTGMKLSRASMP